MPLLDNLVEFWTLNNTKYGYSNTLLKRYDGGANLFVSGKIGGAWDTNNVANYTLIQDGTASIPSGMNGSAPFSISLWYKFNRTITSGSDGIAVPFALHLNPSNQVRIEFIYMLGDYYMDLYYTGGYISWNPASVDKFDKNWHHFVGVIPTVGSNAKIYVDGSLKKSISVNATTSFVPIRVTLNGNYETPPGYPADVIDAVGYWNRVLVQDDVDALYNSGNGWEPPSLQAIHSINGDNIIRNCNAYVNTSGIGWKKNTRMQKLDSRITVDGLINDKLKDVTYYDGDR